MLRLALYAFVALSLATLGASFGCAKKTTTVHMQERVVESEPAMVSPGQEIVE